MMTIRKPKGRLRELETERYILSTLPVLWLPLYRKDGSSFISADGFGHLATVTGATWGLQGRTFDGVDDVINCGSGTVFDALTGPFTFEAWINPTTMGEAGEGWIINKYEIALQLVGANLIQFNAGGLTGATFINSSNALTLGQWSHAVGVYDGSNLHVWLNGIVTTSASATGTITDHSAYDLLIGDHYLGIRTFDGTIGECRVYSRALTANEIQRNYLATRWRYQ